MYSRYDEDFGGQKFVAFLMERKKRLNFNAPRKLLKRRDVDHRFVVPQVSTRRFFFGRQERKKSQNLEVVKKSCCFAYFFCVLSWMSKCDL